MHANDKDVASAIAREIAARIGKERFDIWFRESTRLELADKVLTVWVPNSFFEGWLRDNFGQQVREAARAVTGRPVTVRFEVNGHLPSRKPEPPAVVPVPVPGAGADAGSPPQRRLAALEEFVAARSNRLAYAAAQRVCQTPSAEFNPLVLYGSPGLGKSHLLEGICGALRRNHRGLRVALLSAEEFTNQFIESLRSGSLPSFRKKHRGVDVLLVDDLHFLISKRATQEEFLHTFKCLAARQRQVVVAADSHPRLLPWASEELASRLVQGMACPLERPDFETRLRILEAKARRLQADLPEDVLRYVAEQAASNVRELEGALNTLTAYRKLMRAAIDVAAARNLLGHMLCPPRQSVELGDIEQAVCNLFGVKPAGLKSPRRSRQLSQPRMLAMYLARKHTQMACSDIGRYFGGRNHTTVVSAQKKVSAWIGNGTGLATRGGRRRAEDVVAMIERSLLA
ncbi:MAG: chromosomal replication initiator protein DnaA [Pirellulales bacterium]